MCLHKKCRTCPSDNSHKICGRRVMTRKPDFDALKTTEGVCHFMLRMTQSGFNETAKCSFCAERYCYTCNQDEYCSATECDKLACGECRNNMFFCVDCWKHFCKDCREQTSEGGCGCTDMPVTPVPAESTPRTDMTREEMYGKNGWVKSREVWVPVEAKLCPCGAKGTKKCGKCKLVYYCSISCQHDHWTDHKQFCSILHKTM